MPPKAQRDFIVDDRTGEIRCSDPCCQVTQCGQCNKEQGARKRAQRKLKNQEQAAVAKAAEQEQAIQEAAAKEAEGKQHRWTFDREEEDEGKLVMNQLQDLDEQRFQGISAAADRQIEQLQNIVENSDSQFETEKAKVTKTTWNHCTRLLLYNCIAKFNPFAAPVKKDAWSKVADEMAQSTALMNDPQKGDFRVKTDGHGLEVFYGRRCEEMNRKLSQEASLSGQGGAIIPKEVASEYAVLQGCVAKEKDAAFIRDKKRKSKSALEDLRNNEVTKKVKEAALEDVVVMKRTYKLLQTKVRAAKLEAAVWEKSHNALGKYAYSNAQLADIEYLQDLKKHFAGDESELGDAMPESDGVAEKKRGGVAQAISELASKLPCITGVNVDAASFAKSFFEAKRLHQISEIASDAAPRKRTLKERLDEVDVQLQEQLINETECAYFKAEIKKKFFLSD
jgi:hypothetical protein